ncbi:uncharacterized protein [Rutidosis leptorrhynchoides]|uniref:uncharacterized protein n=1 Tax=Rutidosis leptorrhynchoides TaxID=125765 RepID=UPI003A991E9A
MDGDDRLRRRRSLHERLGLACCGSIWGIRPSTMSIHGDDDHVGLVDQVDQLPEVIRTLPDSNSDLDCVFPSPRMNLAAALAAERQSRSTVEGGESLTSDNNRLTTPVTPSRVSLMRLLEETDDQDEKEVMGNDLVCCVCMGRKKGAAFIPCGHTYCRVCSRELWLNRGSCPLCNRAILEILDIF